MFRDKILATSLTVFSAVLTEDKSARNQKILQIHRIFIGTE